MKTTKCILLFLLLGFSTMAQEKKETVLKKERKVFVKFFFSPTYSFNVAKASQSTIITSYPDWYVKYTFDNKKEVGDWGFNCGILLDIKLNKRINMETGIMREEINYKINKGTVFLTEEYGDQQNGPPVFETRNDIAIKHKYIFFTAPLIVNYKINQKKLFYNVGSGFAIDILRSFYTIFTIGDSGIEGTRYTYHIATAPNFSIIPYLSFIFKLGICYQPRKNFIIGIEPTLKYFLKNNHEPSSYGYNFGFNRQLKMLNTGANLFIRF